MTKRPSYLNIGIVAVVLAAALAIAFWLRPASNDWFMAEGKEELEKYLTYFSIQQTSEVSECEVIDDNAELDVHKLFSCKISVVDGILYFDAAFYRSGGIKYTYAEVRRN